MKIYDLMRQKEQKIRTDYKVNKEKGIIVCIISTFNDFENKLEKYELLTDYYTDVFPKFKQYIGIAKCNPDDEWNEIYGKRLAEFRAACARKNYLNTKINDYTKMIIKRLEALNHHGKLKNPHRPKET